MKPGINAASAVLLAASVTLLSVAAGVGTWLLVRQPGPQRPEISAYSHGHLTRVGPYLYCNVLNLDDCQTPQTQGELPVERALSGAAVGARSHFPGTVAATAGV